MRTATPTTRSVLAPPRALLAVTLGAACHAIGQAASAVARVLGPLSDAAAVALIRRMERGRG